MFFVIFVVEFLLGTLKVKFSAVELSLLLRSPSPVAELKVACARLFSFQFSPFVFSAFFAVE